MTRVAGGRLAALAVLCAFADVGCHRGVIAPPPIAAPVAGGAEVKSAADVRRLLAARDRDTQTLTATFKLTFHRADGSEESSRGALVVARPDRLRLQVFSFGMITAYDYTVNGDRFRVRRPLEGVDRRGTFSEAKGEDALGADLRPLFLRTGDFAAAAISETESSYLVRVTESHGERAIEIGKRDGRIARETITIDGETSLVTEYSDYRDVDGVALPLAIRVTDPSKHVRLAIDVDRYTRNQPAADELFAF